MLLRACSASRLLLHRLERGLLTPARSSACRSSWNHFGGNGSHGNGRLGAAMLMEIADAMVSSGLRDAGYK